MIEIETEQQYIRLRNLLIHISKVVEIDNIQNLNNINIFLEGIFCGLLNIVYDGYDYKNLNTYSDKNHPGVDLSDDSKHSYFQVTSTPTQHKVNKSYRVFMENRPSEETAVYSLKFLILKIKARSSEVKLPDNYDGSAITFDPSTDYLDFAKLLNIVSQLDGTTITRCIQYLEETVKDNPLNATDTDAEVLKAFFNALNSAASEDSDEIETILSTSEMSVKKERLGAFWDHVYSCYQTLILPSQEIRFKGAYNRLDDGARAGIERFLQYNSFILLEKYPNPEQAFRELQALVLRKISPFPISHSELSQYLYMEIIFCNVFPNPRTK